jgi:hypothetical protein
MSDVKVYLGGEGKNELGSRAGEPQYQSMEIPGLVETLLRRVKSEGWSVQGATPWKRIRKFRAKGPVSAEERNVLGLVEMACRADASVVAFVRDADGDSERLKIIASAIQKAEEIYPSIKVIGGSAIPVLEGWILAMQGEHRTEELSKVGAQQRLRARGIDKDTRAMTDVAAKLDLKALPQDAYSLNDWLKRAGQVLSPPVD